MKPYQCIRPCFFEGRLWEIGQTAMFNEGEWPKDKNGKIRHFVPIEPPAPVHAPEESKPEEDTGDSIPLFSLRSPKPKKAK